MRYFRWACHGLVVFLVLTPLLYFYRQLATSAAGIPLFEIFLTMDKKGEFKSQVSLLDWPIIFIANAGSSLYKQQAIFSKILSKLRVSLNKTLCSIWILFSYVKFEYMGMLRITFFVYCQTSFLLIIQFKIPLDDTCGWWKNTWDFIQEWSILHVIQNPDKVLIFLVISNTNVS